MDCSSPGSTGHNILQARILEWVATPFSKDLPDPGIKPGLLHCRQILYCLSHQRSPIWTFVGKVTPLLFNKLSRFVILIAFLPRVPFNFNNTVQFSSVTQPCPTLCDPMNRSTPGLPVHHQLLEFTQTHVHQVSDAIQPSHPLSSPTHPAPNPSQHQSLFQ